MNLERLEPIVQKNNELDVLNTNMHQISANEFAVLKKLIGFTQQINETGKFKDEFMQHASQLKSQLEQIIRTYNIQIGKTYDQLMYEGVIEKIRELQSNVQYVKNVMEYANACIDVLNYNSQILYDTSVGGMAYANIINHNDYNIGMQYAADRFYKLLTYETDEKRPYVEADNIKWNNWNKPQDRITTNNKMLSVIEEQILKVPRGGLYIFWYGGHGGSSGNGAQYLSLPNCTIWDYNLWELFKKCKGRVFAIFNCCHAGTMYRGIQDDSEINVMNDDIGDVRPFGCNWFKQNPKSRTIYTEDTVPNWNEFDSFDPVYVELSKDNDDGVRMLCFSASHQDAWEMGDVRKGSYFNTAMCSTCDSHNADMNFTYKDLFDLTYPVHKKMIDDEKCIHQGYTVKGSAMCTYTSGFKPDQYQMFR